MKVRFTSLIVIILLSLVGCDAFVSPAKRLLRADEAAATGDYGRAVIELRNVLQAQPQNVTARIKLVKMLLLQSDISRAEAEVAGLREISATSSEAADMVAQVQLAKLDFSGLIDAITSGHLKLTSALALKRHAQALLGLNKAQEAIGKLEEALKEDPEDLEVHIIYAQALAASGDSNGALKKLESVVAKAPNNARAWLTKGLLSMRLGNTTGGTQSLSQAVAHANAQLTRAETLTALMVLVEQQIAMGDMTTAVENQKRMVVISPDATATLLIAAKIAYAQEDYSTAVAELQKVVAKQPDMIMARLLLGSALAIQGNLRQAESVFEKVVADAPTHHGARKALAAVNLQLHQNVKAIEILAPLVYAAQSDPETIALITQAQSVTKSVADLEKLRKSVSREPNNEALRIIVGGTLLKAGQNSDAVTVLRGDKPEQIDLLRVPLLLSAVVAERGISAAQQEANRIGDAYANRPGYLATMGLFFVDKKEYATARSWLERALVKLPTADDSKSAATLRANELKFLRSLAILDVKAGDRDAALARVNKYKLAHPEETAVAAIEADVLMESGDYIAAEKSYQAALNKQASADIAIKIFRARQLGKMPSPIEPLVQWLKNHPDDIGVRLVLAEAYQINGNAQAAISEYEGIVATQPTNAAALNNLAWLYQEHGDKRAEGIARQAYERAGRSAAVADTYGWILLQNGKSAQALKILATAAATTPQPEIHYHYAVALSRTGSAEAARKQLEEILARHPSFAARSEAEKMLADISKNTDSPNVKP